MSIIRVLDGQLANQIAAGEVVERPASVVKELVENAIDADATRIAIRIKEGGIREIQVSDNGHGMVPEDAVRSFQRHATSKIKKERDLFSIQTLGFRGEALPSIASIARVTLTTAFSPDHLATRVYFEGGEQGTMESCSRSMGTDVVVNDLFYNTPARLKYLKTVNTEISHIADIIGRLAMAHPSTSFHLTHQGRELFRTPGDGKLKHVIHAIYGRQVASQLLPVHIENFDFQIQGYITKPETTRASRSYISLVLNGRVIRSLPLTQALLRAYGTLLPTGRYPIGVLHIQMDPKLTDVNVHPTKLEVRLSKENECSQLIKQGIKDAFRGQTLIPGAPTVQSTAQKKDVQEQLTFQTYPPSTPIVKEAKGDWDENHHGMDTKPQQEPTFIRELKVPSDENAVADDLRMKSEFTAITAETNTEPEKPSDVEDVENESEPSSFPALFPLGQIHGTYIVAQAENGFYLMDQHAAHERIYYELFYEKLGKTNHAQQMLLVPLTIECTHAEAELLSQSLNQLKVMGLAIEPFGGTTFLVHAHPTWFPEGTAQSLINEMITLIKERDQINLFEMRDTTAKMMSCKAAIKANRHLRQEEMESLIRQLATCKQPFTCPHGRPIVIHFSTYHLEKMFKRVM